MLIVYNNSAGGYYILKWANGKGGGEDGGKGMLSSGSIGDSLNNFSGGRLTGFMDAAKDERAKGDISGFSDKHTKPAPPAPKEKQEPKEKAEGQPNGAAKKQNVGSGATSQTSKATEAAGVQKTGANATGTVKGGVGGATGLT